MTNDPYRVPPKHTRVDPAAQWRERAEKAEAKIQAARELCHSAKVVISKGCLCHGDECSGTCGRGTPLGWNLNPDDILHTLDKE